MSERLTRVLGVLERLVGFETLPGQSNVELINWVTTYLSDLGVAVSISADDSGRRRNLYATIGPERDGGVMLNGHTDVVPARGQAWTGDPFRLRVEDGRAYGRGAVDMKGFLALCLAAVPAFQAAALRRPVHLGFCFDEEIGGFGAAILSQDVVAKPYRPAACIVGEPTSLGVVAGHKGGYEMRAEIHGSAGHASDPRRGANAIFIAARLIARIEEIGRELAKDPDPDSPYDPPWATVSVGAIRGGEARNIIAGHCAFDWEIRPVKPEDGPRALGLLREFVDETLLPEMRAVAPKADIQLVSECEVPPLAPMGGEDPAIALALELTGADRLDYVSFGTDAGYFQRVGIPSVVCGPGSIEQAHKADEYIELAALGQGLDFLDRLADKLSQD